jgi:hypothetical protein
LFRYLLNRGVILPSWLVHVELILKFVERDCVRDSSAAITRFPRAPAFVSIRRHEYIHLRLICPRETVLRGPVINAEMLVMMLEKHGIPQRPECRVPGALTPARPSNYRSGTVIGELRTISAIACFRNET